MSSTTYKRRIPTSLKNKTQKNKTQKNKLLKICDLGIKGTMKPCCDKDKDGIQCHVKPIFLDIVTKRLTRNNSIQMTKEHDDYKEKEQKLFGSIENQMTCLDISRKINTKGINEVKKIRSDLANIIKMRRDWLTKWYVLPTSQSNCYVCDANARNHNGMIIELQKCLDRYDDAIEKYERNTAVSSRTRSTSNTTMRSRPRLNISKRKKDNYEKIDSVTRRQKLVAMLAKKKESQERRRLSSHNRKLETALKKKKESQERRRLSSEKKSKGSSKK